jgi:hypothetical protein
MYVIPVLVCDSNYLYTNVCLYLTYLLLELKTLQYFKLGSIHYVLYSNGNF